MKKLTPAKAVISIFLGIILMLSCFFIYRHIKTAPAKAGSNTIMIGDVPLSDYCIVSRIDTYFESRKLADYIYKSTGNRLKIKFKSGKHNIFLSKKTDNTILHIEKGDVYLLAKGKELDRLVTVCANSLLGFSFAGEDREHLSHEKETLYLPSNLTINSNSGWMPEREPIVCLWNPSMTRGVYYNQNTAPESDILRYSDDDLYEYVRMMQHLGFTGIQVTDICAAWAEFGSYEYVHERLRFMADAAHSLGMKFTLWVWGSEFNGYGWNDTSVKYHGDSVSEIDLPEVTETYEKYYNIYAELADVSDRVIVHYFEPGNVHTMKNAGFFARKLYEKFAAVNPDVNFGINVYSNYFNVDVLKDSLGDLADKITYYTLSALQMDGYGEVRQIIADNSLKYGIWSWGVIEREIDQTAWLNVNSRVIQDTYLNTMAYDGITKPDYWSEMDSYHILNVFSLYCSGKLLTDPTKEADSLVFEAANAAVGEAYGEDLAKVLLLIQKARGGNDIHQFAEGDFFLLESPDYPAEEILKESNEAIDILDGLLAVEDLKCTIPVSVDMHRILELIRPHLLQIRAFAEFRVAYDEMCKMAEAGESRDSLQKMVAAVALKDIEEYDVVTGVWGVNEQRIQTKFINGFCEKYGLNPVHNDRVDNGRKQRIMGEFKSLQITSDAMLLFDKKTGFQMGAAYGEAETERLVNELVSEGLLSESDEDPSKVYVSDWNKLN